MHSKLTALLFVCLCLDPVLSDIQSTQIPLSTKQSNPSSPPSTLSSSPTLPILAGTMFLGVAVASLIAAQDQTEDDSGEAVLHEQAEIPARDKNSGKKLGDIKEMQLSKRIHSMRRSKRIEKALEIASPIVTRPVEVQVWFEIVLVSST